MTTVSRFCFLRWPLAGVALLLLAATWTTEARAQSPASQLQLNNQLSAILLTNTKVQKELNLTETQIAETAEPAQKLNREIMSLAFNPEYRDQPGKIQAMIGKIKEKEKEMLGRLNRQQQQRLQQLFYQRLGLRLFQNVDVQKSLQLTKDQQQKNQKILESLGNKMKAMIATSASDPSSMVKQSKRLMAEAREAINQLLTEKQREQVAQMKGKPFAPFANQQ